MNRRANSKSAVLAATDASAAPPESAAAGPDGQVAFTIIAHVKPGHEAELLDLVTPVLDAMRHEKTFINAVLHRDPEDPTRFMLYETWSDLDDVVEVQIHRAYRKAFLERLPEILREDRAITIWQPIRADFTFFGPGTTPG